MGLTYKLTGSHTSPHALVPSLAPTCCPHGGSALPRETPAPEPPPWGQGLKESRGSKVSSRWKFRPSSHQPSLRVENGNEASLRVKTGNEASTEVETGSEANTSSGLSKTAP